MADPRDDLVERVAQIVYEAMRFDRENYTPPWKNGNSRAEDEARATAARLRAEVAWHVEDKDKWQDTQAAHLREIARLTAEVKKLWAALEPLACTCDRPNGAACSRSEVDCPFWNARAAITQENTNAES